MKVHSIKKENSVSSSSSSFIKIADTPSTSSEPSINCHQSSSVPAFLEKLYDLLSDSSGYQEYISWQPDGKSFLIKKAGELSDKVLPRFFKHNNLQSFIRQLNMYNFSKTKHDANHREFKHELFQRGRSDLLHLIKRKSTPQRNGRSAVVVESEPDFTYHVAQSDGHDSGYDADVWDNPDIGTSHVQDLQMQVWMLTDRCEKLEEKVTDLVRKSSTCSTCSQNAESSLVDAAMKDMIRMVSVDHSLHASSSLAGAPLSRLTSFSKYSPGVCDFHESKLFPDRTVSDNGLHFIAAAAAAAALVEQSHLDLSTDEGNGNNKRRKLT